MGILPLVMQYIEYHKPIYSSWGFRTSLLHNCCGDKPILYDSSNDIHKHVSAFFIVQAGK